MLLRKLHCSLASLITAGLITSTALAQSLSSDMQPEIGEFRVGVMPWLGYGQWYVAQEHGFFNENGLNGVEIINFAEDKDINAALVSGSLDGASIALHTAMAMKSAGVPIQIVSMLDVSEHADAMIANGEVDSLEALAGKSVAFEEGTTSDILLRDALKSVGLSLADIQAVPMPASTAGSALISGRVPVAVTYEPYLSTARANDADVQVLYDGGDNLGLISDVFVVRDEVAENRPGQVLAMIESWDQAVKHYLDSPQKDQAIIAEAVGADVGSLKSAFDGVKYYGLADSEEAFNGKFLSQTFTDVLKAAQEAGFVQGEMSSDELIDTRFVEALSP